MLMVFGGTVAEMTDKGSDRRTPADAPMAPHPVLGKYYGSEGDRRPFVTALFDSAAGYYDWVCAVGSLGSGQFYRRWVLEHTGLRPGMRLLDVATGTGLVARAALRILREPGAVIGLDPSSGMLREARKTLAVPLVQGRVETVLSRGELVIEEREFVGRAGHGTYVPRGVGQYIG